MGRGLRRAVAVNNGIYFALGEHWYADEDSPVALLRAESKLRNPWIASRLDEVFGARPCRVLDVGCGAGFLSNDIARRDREVTGIDIAPDALAVARAHDATRA